MKKSLVYTKTGDQGTTGSDRRHPCPEDPHPPGSVWHGRRTELESGIAGNVPEWTSVIRTFRADGAG